MKSFRQYIKENGSGFINQDLSERISLINECLSLILEKLVDDPVEPGKAKAPSAPPARYRMSEPYTDYSGKYHAPERVYVDDIGPKESPLAMFDPFNSQDPWGAFGVGLASTGLKAMEKAAARKLAGTGSKAISTETKAATTGFKSPKAEKPESIPGVKAPAESPSIGGYTPDETGHVSMTTYHGGDLGEGDGPVSVSHIRFPGDSGSSISRPSRRELTSRQQATPDQPLSSYTTFSTTADPTAADMYRGGRGKNLYTIKTRVHRDNVRHFDSFEGYNKWFTDIDQDPNFQTFMTSHPTYGKTISKNARNRSEFDRINKQLLDRHEEWKKTVPEIPETPSNATADEIIAQMKKSDERQKSIDAELEKMKTPEWRQARSNLDASTEEMRGIFGSSPELDSLQRALARMKHEYIRNNLKIQAAIMSQGSGKAVKHGEVHIFDPSVIQSIDK